MGTPIAPTANECGTGMGKSTELLFASNVVGLSVRRVWCSPLREGGRFDSSF